MTALIVTCIVVYLAVNITDFYNNYMVIRRNYEVYDFEIRQLNKIIDGHVEECNYLRKKYADVVFKLSKGDNDVQM